MLVKPVSALEIPSGGYRLVALDMDGTLLNSAGTLSQKTIDYFNEIPSGGTEYVFATGRMPEAIKPILNRLNISPNVISHNGALISNLRTGEIVLEKSLPHNVVDLCIRLHHQYCVTLHCNTAEGVFAESATWESTTYAWHLGLTVYYHQFDEEVLRKTIRSILFIGTKLLLTDILVNLKRMFPTGASYVFIQDTGANWLLQVLPFGTSKGSGVRAYAQQCSIPYDNVLVFGDSYNDTEMFQYCGTCIAMGNAVHELQYHADAVTDTNDRDGVVQALKQLIQPERSHHAVDSH